MIIKVFMSYRRDNSAPTAGRIYDGLKAASDTFELFMDIDDIPAGANFAEFIEAKLSNCDVILVLIGNSWLNLREKPLALKRLAPWVLEADALITQRIGFASRLALR